MNKSIATRSPLTKETFADFVLRLRHDCEGDGVNRHYTSDAIFIVQQKVRTYGYTEEYSSEKMIYRDDSTWYSIKEFWDSLDENERKTLDDIALNGFTDGKKFVDTDEHDQWYILQEEQTEFTVVGYKEGWKYVNAHFTRDGAEAFIKRKKHDYDELRIYVDSQYWCWEFNEIKNAILSGKLTYAE